VIEYKKIERIPGDEVFEKIKQFCLNIFSAFDSEKLERRFGEAKHLLINLAFDGEKLVGFKVGYQIDPTKFYSWLGGVDENYRKCGIAQELMKRQHDWCVEKSYKVVQTKTKNSFKPMLILNIKNGFDIVGVYHNSRNELKIVLEKTLSKF
jgi:predicted GNAT superfamily acetyltransferase